MKLTRFQRVMIGLLIAQVAVLVLLRHPFGAGKAGSEHPLLPTLASMTPSKLEITDGEGTAVTLEKSGGAWVLDQPKGYPVAAGKVEKAIQSLEHVKVARPMVTSPTHHAALRVADSDFERRVRLWSGDAAKPALEVYLGKAGAGGATAIRAGGKNEVYEASGVSAYDLSGRASDWIDRNLVPVQPEQVARLDLQNPKGSFSIEKRDGAWRVVTPASRRASAVDSTKVLTLLRSLCGLSVDEPVGPPDASAEGLAEPEARFSLTPSGSAATSATVTARIGKADPAHNGDRYAERSGLDFAVRVSSWSTERALGATLADVLAK